EDRISRTQYQMTLSDPDRETLLEWVPRFEDAMRQLPQLTDVVNDQQAGGLQTVLKVNRDAAARLGITMSAIDEALYDAFGQRLVSTIFTQSAQYRVVLE